MRRGAKVGALYDAMAGGEFPLVALEAIRRGLELPSTDGTIRCWSTSAAEELALPEQVEIKRSAVEQSNSTAMIGNRAVFKAYRKLAPGVQPEIEIGRFLVEEAGFANTPPLLGAIERVGADGETTALAAAFGFVRNQGDGWVYTIEYLHRTLDELRLRAAAEHPETAAGAGRAARLLPRAGARARTAHRRAAPGARDADRRPRLRRRADRRGRSQGLAARGAPPGRGGVQGAAPGAAAGSTRRRRARRRRCSPIATPALPASMR